MAAGLGAQSEQLAPSGAPRFWDYPDADAHSVHFYADDAYLIEGLARFIGSSIAQGNPAVILATEPHRRPLQDLLAARGVDLSVARDQGRYVELDARQTLDSFLVDGWPDRERFLDAIGSTLAAAAGAAEEGHRRVAAFGEMVALLYADGRPEAAIRLERLWNELAQTYSFYLPCAYPMGAFTDAGDAEHLAAVCAEHSTIVPAESYTALGSEDDQRRLIAVLQQKAQVLEREIDRLRTLEEDLLQRVAAAAGSRT